VNHPGHDRTPDEFRVIEIPLGSNVKYELDKLSAPKSSMGKEFFRRELLIRLSSPLSNETS
jgi:hypothetical protein